MKPIESLILKLRSLWTKLQPLLAPPPPAPPKRRIGFNREKE